MRLREETIFDFLAANWHFEKYDRRSCIHKTIFCKLAELISVMSEYAQPAMWTTSQLISNEAHSIAQVHYNKKCAFVQFSSAYIIDNYNAQASKCPCSLLHLIANGYTISINSRIKMTSSRRKSYMSQLNEPISFDVAILFESKLKVHGTWVHSSIVQ